MYVDRKNLKNGYSWLLLAMKFETVLKFGEQMYAGAMSHKALYTICIC